MKRTKKKKQYGQARETIDFLSNQTKKMPAKCSFDTSDVDIKTLKISFNDAPLLKGESLGFTQFFKKAMLAKCANKKELIPTCYSIFSCLNKTRDISDMLYDIFTEDAAKEADNLEKFIVFFIEICIPIIYEYIKQNPKASKPLLLTSLSRQFSIIFEYQKNKERVLKYIRALITKDKTVLAQFNSEPVGDPNYIDKYHSSNSSKKSLFSNKELLQSKLIDKKVDILAYYNDRMEIFMEENDEVKLFENPDFKQGQGKNAGGFGQYFLIFVVGMLGLSFIVEKGINWDRKDTFYI